MIQYNNIKFKRPVLQNQGPRLIWPFWVASFLMWNWYENSYLKLVSALSVWSKKKPQRSLKSPESCMSIRDVFICDSEKPKASFFLQGLPIHLKEDVKDASVQRLGVTQLEEGKPVVYPFRSLNLHKQTLHRLQRMCPTPCLCLDVSAQRGKAVPGSDQELLEALMNKARGSTSTSIKHCDVLTEIRYCG